ncbi:MAG: mechanosensitive ion channel family protein [archaeon]|nr:mechanosensitive ion channel family protein [archaeon]
MPPKLGILLSVAIALLAVFSVMHESSNGEDIAEDDLVTDYKDIFICSEKKIKMSAADEYILRFCLGNRDTKDVTVTISSENPAFNISVDTPCIHLEKGELKEVSVALSADRYTSPGNYPLKINISIVGTELDFTHDIIVDIVSNHSFGKYFNKFFGFIDNGFDKPFDTVIITTVITMIAWIGIGIFTTYFLLKSVNFLLTVINKKSTALGWGAPVSIFLCVILAGINNCIHIAWINEKIADEVFKLSNIAYVFLLAFIIWDVYKVLVTSALLKIEKTDSVDSSLIPPFKAIGKIVIVLVSLAIVFSLFNVSLITLVASVGLVGLGLSFGIKPVISELFSGLIVLITHPFKIGDYVSVGDIEAMKVTEFGILRTKFKTNYKSELLTIPNSVISRSKLTNLTNGSKKYRTSVSVKVPFTSNFTSVRKIMEDVANNHPNVIKDGSVPKPTTFFTACSGDTVVMTLIFYIDNYEIDGTICGQIRELLLKKFEDVGVKIPYNKMTATIFEGGAPGGS